MKFSLIAAVVVLALAQGSFAQDATDLEKLGQYFEEMKNKMTQDLTEMLKNQDLATQAQTLATSVQEQMKTIATNMEQQLKPLTDNVQAQAQPMFDSFRVQMEAIFQKVAEQAKAIGN